jgi:predicted RNA-binding Zn-ribbon protein involved in translation (DUF1610 family)
MGRNKMGRRKGSKNNTHRKIHKKVKGRRGRPKGPAKKKAAPTELHDMSNVKTYKFLGFCKKCEFQISKKELVSKTIYECPSCGKKDKISKLIKKLSTEKPKSKKEYLESTIHSTHIAHLPLNDVSIGPDDLKVQE